MVLPGLEEIASEEISTELHGEVKRTGKGVVVFRVPQIDERLLAGLPKRQPLGLSADTHRDPRGRRGTEQGAFQFEQACTRERDAWPSSRRGLGGERSWDVSRPGTGYRSQSFAICLRVDRGREVVEAGRFPAARHRP